MLLILTGKTASGKDTIMRRILAKYPEMGRVITTTSRPPRPGEKQGLDYNFFSPEEFRQKIEAGDFIEYVEYGGNFYGTEKSQINPDDDLIWKIDPSMAGKAKSLFENSKVIYINCDARVILKRLRDRGLSEEEIQKRIQDDQRFWQQYGQNYDYVIENTPGKLDQTVEKVTRIINLFH